MARLFAAAAPKDSESDTPTPRSSLGSDNSLFVQSEGIFGKP
ncbi:MAG: hypothetical protein V7L01_04205 [Nostoc sp.]